MVESNWARAAHRFGKWYSSAILTDIWIPPRLRSRECMFEQWTAGKYDRHISFERPNEVLQFFQSRICGSYRAVFFSLIWHFLKKVPDREI